MGNLERRLEGLEAMMARIPVLSEPEVEARRQRLCETVLIGRGPRIHDEEECRLLERLTLYVPIYLGLVREGLLPGRDELLATGVSFDEAVDCSEIVGGRIRSSDSS